MALEEHNTLCRRRATFNCAWCGLVIRIKRKELGDRLTVQKQAIGEPQRDVGVSTGAGSALVPSIVVTRRNRCPSRRSIGRRSRRRALRDGQNEDPLRGADVLDENGVMTGAARNGTGAEIVKGIDRGNRMRNTLTQGPWTVNVEVRRRELRPQLTKK